MFTSIALSSALAGIVYKTVNGKKEKLDDRKKIKRLFEIANICVKEKDIIKYPVYQKSIEHSSYQSHIYRLPLGIPSKLIQKFEEIISESLSKPVTVEYNNYLLEVKVFYQDIPDSYDWNENLTKPNSWKVCIGKSLNEYVYHDYDVSPHMVVGGMTRFGKTVFLKNVITDLILQQEENVEFYILDLKGGLEYHKFKSLKQVKGVAENPEQCFFILNYIREKFEKRMEWMKAKDYQDIRKSPIKTRTFVIVDEAAELTPDKSMTKEQKDLLGACLRYLQYIACVSGGLGGRLIFCTQYGTSDVLPRQIKQNCDTRIGFRLADMTGSQVVIDRGGLEELPRLPGRAIYKTDICTELQVPFIDNKTMWEVLSPYERGKSERDTIQPIPTKIRNSPSATGHAQSAKHTELPASIEESSGFELAFDN
jgi:S-DNA-T family DNA segregation ATPase FtsK/SpoIIIE